MELEHFITESIVQITNGIMNAQHKLKDERVRVNPKPSQNVTATTPMLYCAENGAAVFPLNFDVAVSSEDVQGGISGGIKVLNIGINAEDKSQQSMSRVSRICFTIPIAYPLKQRSVTNKRKGIS